MIDITITDSYSGTLVVSVANETQNGSIINITSSCITMDNIIATGT